jgi:hypothetical protein
MKRLTITRRNTLLAATTLAAASALGAKHAITGAQAELVSASTPSQPASAEEAFIIAQEAYIYLYPLILMDLTRRQLTNLDPTINPIGGPTNAFTHIRTFPPADMRAVVRPNFDTLYSSVPRPSRCGWSTKWPRSIISATARS